MYVKLTCEDRRERDEQGQKKGVHEKGGRGPRPPRTRRAHGKGDRGGEGCRGRRTSTFFAFGISTPATLAATTLSGVLPLALPAPMAAGVFAATSLGADTLLSPLRYALRLLPTVVVSPFILAQRAFILTCPLLVQSRRSFRVPASLFLAQCQESGWVGCG